MRSGRNTTRPRGTLHRPKDCKVSTHHHSTHSPPLCGRGPERRSSPWRSCLPPKRSTYAPRRPSPGRAARPHATRPPEGKRSDRGRDPPSENGPCTPPPRRPNGATVTEKTERIRHPARVSDPLSIRGVVFNAGSIREFRPADHPSGVSQAVLLGGVLRSGATSPPAVRSRRAPAPAPRGPRRPRGR